MHVSGLALSLRFNTRLPCGELKQDLWLGELHAGGDGITAAGSWTLKNNLVTLPSYLRYVKKLHQRSNETSNFGVIFFLVTHTINGLVTGECNTLFTNIMYF